MISAGRAGIRSVWHSRYFLWLILVLPAAIQTYRYRQGAIFYGEYLHWSGELAAQLLIVVLAITPLRLAFPQARWVRWLMMRRRYLGVATFGYSVLHAVAYLERQETVRTILDDALSIGMGAGWIALALLLLLAMTSNDASVRLLRRAWKSLHRAVYAAALLTFAHWILTAFDPLTGWVYLGILAALQAFRVWKARTNARRRADAPIH